MGRAQRGGRSSRYRARSPVACAMLAGSAVVLPLTAGCSVEEVLRFGWPVGVTPQADAMRELWTCVGDRGAGRRGDHLGRDVLGGGLPPQAQGRRRHAAAADPVQPARRDRLHGGPDDHRGGAVRVHRQRAELRRHRRAEPGPERPGPSASSGTGASTTRTARGRRASRSARWAPASTIPLLVLPTDRRIEFTQRSNDVIHSFFVPEFLFKRDVFPTARGQRPGQRLADRPDRTRGRVRRALRRAVRQLPLADELRGQGPGAGAVRPLARSARADQPGHRSALHRRGGARRAELRCSCARRSAYTTYPFTTERDSALGLGAAGTTGS